jgi:hypothetical protein
MGCDTVSVEWFLVFQRIAVPSFLGVKQFKKTDPMPLNVDSTLKGRDML